MELTAYNYLVSYASRVLPINSLLEPMDLVNEAFLQVGDTNHRLLKKTIISLAYKQRTEISRFVPYVDYISADYKLRSPALVETSRVCKGCQKEKGFDSFWVKSFQWYDSQCKECRLLRKQELHALRKDDPEYKAKLRELGRAQRERNRLRRQADPAYDAHWKELRQLQKQREKLRKADLEYKARVKEQDRARRERNRARRQADPAYDARRRIQSRLDSERWRMRRDAAKSIVNNLHQTH